MSNRGLFTIGHSNHSIEHFVELLKAHLIDVVVDVRSKPTSSRNPQFNRDSLKASLALFGIKYLFLGKELGARRSEREAYEGRVATYEKIAMLPTFRHGLDRVVKGVGSFRVALMCAEKDPLDCHRTVLVCRNLRDEIEGEILHIRSDGSIETHAQIEQRLVADMGLNIDQTEMFESQGEPTLERAYRKRGQKIAYQEESEIGD